MSAFSNWWKSSSWLPLISKLKRYYSYSLVLVSAISFKQSEAIFVDAFPNFSLETTIYSCLVFQLLEQGWKVKKKQKKLFSGNALSASKSSENHKLLLPQRHSSWKVESQEARFNENGFSSRSKRLVWAPLKHQWPHQAKEFHVIIKITQTCQQTLNTQNVKLALLNVNHLTFRSPRKVARRCKVCLKSAPNQRPAHVGLRTRSALPAWIVTGPAPTRPVKN